MQVGTPFIVQNLRLFFSHRQSSFLLVLEYQPPPPVLNFASSYPAVDPIQTRWVFSPPSPSSIRSLLPLLRYVRFSLASLH